MNIIKLNLARNCLKYLIRLYGIKEIFLPYYSCNSIWQAAREEKCRIKFYHLDENFMPIGNFNQKDYILYINYFGLNNNNCKILSKKYKNIIIDNTQAFYAPILGLASFNSLRKFFNVQNGAFLYTKKLLNESFPSDNIEIEYISAQDDYEKFCQNELLLDCEKNIKTISPKVLKIFEKIDFEYDKLIRREIYNKYCLKLDKINKLNFILCKDEIPFGYPFAPINDNVKNEILSKNVPLIRCWQELPKHSPEYEKLNDLVILPLNKYSKIILS